MNHVCVYALRTYFVCACVCFAEKYMLYKVTRDPSSLSCGSTVFRVDSKIILKGYRDFKFTAVSYQKEKEWTKRFQIPDQAYLEEIESGNQVWYFASGKFFLSVLKTPQVCDDFCAVISGAVLIPKI